MKKKIYIATFFIAPVLCFLLGWATKMPMYGGCIDVCDIAVFAVSIVCGPWVGITCGVGVALSDIVCGAYSSALFSGIISALVGWLCGFTYKYTFASFSVRACKIFALLCGFGLSAVLWLGAGFIMLQNVEKALMLFLMKTVISLVCGLIAYFVLPKIPHIFDEERLERDNNTQRRE